MEVFAAHDLAGRRLRGMQCLRAADADPSAATAAAVLSTFNLDSLPAYLAAALEPLGITGRIYCAPFGQWVQEAVNPASGLYAASPSHVVLAPAIDDLLAPLFERPAKLTEADITSLVRERAAELEQALVFILDRLPAACCFVAAMGPQHAPAEYVFSPGATERGQAAIACMLEVVRSLEHLSPRVVVVDWEWAVRRAGIAAFHDVRLWYLARMRLNQAGCAALAELVAQHVGAYHGRARKVAVVDLDNTLWGGVVGEAGLQGITLGHEGLGLAFRDFQRELLALHDLGVVIAVCSKNNPEDAWEVFDRHPEMLLRREHVAAARINWQDKASNLRELAEELNVGLDSFVFLDDNPVERAWVRTELSGVLVPELPEDPAERPELLRRSAWFRRIRVTQADRQRAESYRAQAVRNEARSKAASVEDFLASLEQVVEIAPLDDGTLARAAQMCQRTNQFNLTTKRYTAADLEAMLGDPSVELYTLALRDRFGDSGITGFAVLRWSELGNLGGGPPPKPTLLERAACEIAGAAAEIDTLLLSCRVLGRRVEDAFLAFLAERARASGASWLVGRYRATAKNELVERFYEDRGFQPLGGTQGRDERTFCLDLTAQSLDVPPQIELRTPALVRAA